MIKSDIKALIGKLGFSCLRFMAEHLIQALTLYPAGNDRRKILQRDLHRIIQSRYKHQKHEERKKGDLPFCKKGSTPFHPQRKNPSAERISG